MSIFVIVRLKKQEIPAKTTFRQGFRGFYALFCEQ